MYYVFGSWRLGLCTIFHFSSQKSEKKVAGLVPDDDLEKS